MGKNETTKIQIHAIEDDFVRAQDFVNDLLKRTSISAEIASETMVVFEALLSLILMQGYDSDTVIDISSDHQLGNFSLKIGFEGKRFNPSDDGEGGASPEMKIIEGFGEKVSYNYNHAYNVIRISVKMTPKGFFVINGVSILVAISTYLVIGLFVDTETQHVIQRDYVFPLEQLLGNALLMIGPPVTMLSLMKNVSDVSIASERTSDGNRLWGKALLTSCLAIAIAFATSYFMSLIVNRRGYYAAYVDEVVDHSFASMISMIIPASIFEPFESVSPIPLIFLAAITTYALCHASVYFEKLKTAINALYELTSWMLRAAMVGLPVFCFLAFLEALLDVGFNSLLYIVELVLSIAGGILVLYATYAIRLRMKGIKVIPFVKKLLPLLGENIAIGSSIDAVPYNVRFCARNYGMDRERLSRKLPVLAQLSLDGNCFILMYTAMICVYMRGTDFAWESILAIAVLVLFLELGAPNQPGGILVGTMIIITFLNLPSMLRMAIYMEVFLGSAQNIINVISNIVTVAEEEGVHYD